MTIPMRIDWEPVKNARRAEIPRGAIKTSVPDLCRRAQIPVRATTDRDVYIYRGRKKIRTPTYDLVGVPTDPNTPRGALRALESLAHSFFDHFARHCVCKRGLFSVPTQRTWQSTKSPKLRNMRNHKRPPATTD